MRNIFLILNSLIIVLLSSWTIQGFQELKPAFGFMLILNAQTIARAFLFWVQLNRDKSRNLFAIKFLTYNYLLFFFVYLIIIAVIIATSGEYFVFEGMVPFALYISLGGVFVLHGINFLLLFSKVRIIILLFVLSYVYVFIIQVVCTINYMGIFDVLFTSIFFAVWTITLSVIGIMKLRNKMNTEG